MSWQTALLSLEGVFHDPANEWRWAWHSMAGARARVGLADDAATAHELTLPFASMQRHSPFAVTLEVICSDLYGQRLICCTPAKSVSSFQEGANQVELFLASTILLAGAHNYFSHMVQYAIASASQSQVPCR